MLLAEEAREGKLDLLSDVTKESESFYEILTQYPSRILNLYERMQKVGKTTLGRFGSNP